MTFCFTLYGEKNEKKFILKEYHSSNNKQRIIKWVNIEDDFTTDFRNYLQNFLREKCLWSLGFVGIDAEKQKKILSPYYNESWAGQEHLLLDCNLQHLIDLLVYEEKTYWYWPFVGVFAENLKSLIFFIKNEISTTLDGSFCAEKIKVLFHF